MTLKQALEKITALEARIADLNKQASEANDKATKAETDLATANEAHKAELEKVRAEKADADKKAADAEQKATEALKTLGETVTALKADVDAMKKEAKTAEERAAEIVGNYGSDAVATGGGNEQGKQEEASNKKPYVSPLSQHISRIKVPDHK